jgi:hypothetical protein
LRAVSATPAGFLVKAFFVMLNALPASEVWLIVRTDRFDHVICYAIASLASVNGLF